LAPLSDADVYPLCPRCGSTTTLDVSGGEFTRRCTRCKWIEITGSTIAKMIKGAMFSPEGRYIPVAARGKFHESKPFRISDLGDGMKGITLTGQIVSVGEGRPLKTRYGEAVLKPCALQDETGTIQLNLWGPQTALASAGAKVKLFGCYVQFYQGHLQLGVAKRGAIQIL